MCVPGAVQHVTGGWQHANAGGGTAVTNGRIATQDQGTGTMTAKKNGTDTAIKANGKAVSPALARSVALHLEGKRKEALKELNIAIENGEETVEVFAAKGHIQFELEQYDDAIKTYDRLLNLAPRHATAHFNLGIWYEKLGRWQEATDAFQKALEADPQREEAQLGLGICLLHQEKPEPAIGYFDQVLARNSSHETALFGKAVSDRKSTR